MSPTPVPRALSFPMTRLAAIAYTGFSSILVILSKGNMGPTYDIYIHVLSNASMTNIYH